MDAQKITPLNLINELNSESIDLDRYKNSLSRGFSQTQQNISYGQSPERDIIDCENLGYSRISNTSISRLQYPYTNVNQILHESPTIDSEKNKKQKGKKLNNRPSIRSAIAYRPIMRINDNRCFRKVRKIKLEKSNSRFNCQFKDSGKDFHELQMYVTNFPGGYLPYIA